MEARLHLQHKSQHLPINNQSTYSDPTLINYSGMDPAMDQLIQEILHSDSFKSWVFQKAIQRVVFYYEEHAVYAYVYELAYGSPLQAFLWQPNNLGMSPVHVELL